MPRKSIKKETLAMQQARKDTQDLIDGKMPEVIVSEKKNSLERKDLLQLHLLLEKKRNKELEVENFKKDLKIKQLELNMQELQLQRAKDALVKMSTDIEEKKKTIDNAMAEFTTCRDRIAKEYEIEGKWGYDEYSGKIIPIPEK